MPGAPRGYWSDGRGTPDRLEGVGGVGTGMSSAEDLDRD